MAKIADTLLTRGLTITSEVLQRVAAIDEFKGRWDALGARTPDRLAALRRTTRRRSRATRRR